MKNAYKKLLILSILAISSFTFIRAGDPVQLNDLSAVLKTVESSFKDEVQAFQLLIEQNQQEIALIKIKDFLKQQENLSLLLRKIAIAVNSKLSEQQRNLFIQFLSDLRNFPEYTQEEFFLAYSTLLKVENLQMIGNMALVPLYYDLPIPGNDYKALQQVKSLQDYEQFIENRPWLKDKLTSLSSDLLDKETAKQYQLLKDNSIKLDNKTLNDAKNYLTHCCILNSYFSYQDQFTNAATMIFGVGMNAEVCMSQKIIQSYIGFINFPLMTIGALEFTDGTAMLNNQELVQQLKDTLQDIVDLSMPVKQLASQLLAEIEKK